MTSLLLRAFLAVLVACTAAAPARGKPPPSRSVEGVVTHVTDGDSLWVTPPGERGIEVRLRDIDAPEICQVWGEEARRALEALVLGRIVVLRITGLDPHGRTLGHVAVDGLDVGHRMVEEGNAWSMRTRWDRGPLVKEERMAGALRRGLHGQPGAVMPRDFRRGHGPCFAAPAADQAPPAATAPPAAAPRLLPAATGPRCDGRTRCSQMTSCDEARFFLKNCPGVQMDGNRDGVPCERQWCAP